MKALSVRAPWWWFILHGGKDVENRDWPTRLRGRVLLHASKWWSLEDVYDETVEAKEMARRAGFSLTGASTTFREMRDLGGHIVGSVEIVDCVEHSASPWFVGPYGFVIRNPVVLREPVRVRGALGFFEVAEKASH